MSKIYKQGKVKFFTEVFNDLKSFDFISVPEFYDHYFLKNIQLIENYSNHYSENKVTSVFKNKEGKLEAQDTDMDKIFNIAIKEYKLESKSSSSLMNLKNFGGKILYIELPCGFFNDYLTSWSGRSDEYDWLGVKNVHWKDVKEKIKSNKYWESESRSCTTYECFDSIKRYGVIRIIENMDDREVLGKLSKTNGKWLSHGGHRIAYLSILGYDIPMIFYINKYLLSENEFIFEGSRYSSFFDDGKYCYLVITPKFKKVEFYLSFYRSSFDKDRDEKVGEIVYE
jgi:hypothetical protein